MAILTLRSLRRLSSSSPNSPFLDHGKLSFSQDESQKVHVEGQQVLDITSKFRFYHDIAYIDKFRFFESKLHELAFDGIISLALKKAAVKALKKNVVMDVRQFLNYAPPHFNLMFLVGLDRRRLSNSLDLDYRYTSIFNFLQYLTLSLDLPWRVVLTSMTVLFQFCHQKSLEKFKSASCLREGDVQIDITRFGERFLHRLPCHERIVLAVSCFLLASKIEEVTSHLPRIITALRYLFGNFLEPLLSPLLSPSSLPASSLLRTSSSRFFGRGSEPSVCHLNEDVNDEDGMGDYDADSRSSSVSASSASFVSFDEVPSQLLNILQQRIIEKEEEILISLGFRIDIRHPHVYFYLFSAIVYSSGSHPFDQSFFFKNFSIIDACVAQLGVSMLYKPHLVALTVLSLIWDEKTEDFPWELFTISSEEKAEIQEICAIIIHDLEEESAQRSLRGENTTSPEPSTSSTLSVMINDLSGAHQKISSRLRKGVAVACRPASIVAFEKMVCEGAFGKVWMGYCKSSEPSEVALKHFKISATKSGYPYYTLREIRWLLTLRHPNILCAKEVLFEPIPHDSKKGPIDPSKGTEPLFNIYVMTDLYEYDLRDIWRLQRDLEHQRMLEDEEERLMSDDYSSIRWSEGHVKELVRQLIEAVHFLNSNGIMHRDIKLENLLFIPSIGRLVLADLGSIRNFSSTLLRMTTHVVTIWYRAPELLMESRKYTPAIDMWSIGCVLYELLTLTILFPGQDEEEMMVRIASVFGQPPSSIFESHPKGQSIRFTVSTIKRSTSIEKLIPDGSSLVHDLLNRMLALDASKRITPTEALKHPYFHTAPLPELYTSWRL